MRTFFLLTISLLSIVLLSSNIENTPKKAPVRHVIMVRYQPQATDAQIAEVTSAFRKLKRQIPGIKSFEHGTNNSSEGMNRDLSHVYVLTFKNVEARDAYLPHPEHVKFGEWLKGQNIIADILVFDYSIKK